jgi:putative ABC transport system permease protein
MYAPVTQGFLMLKILPGDIPSTVSFIEKKWKELVPAHPSDHFFLDDNFDKIYQKERNMLSIFGYFAALAILISCMGLFSLASLMAEQKTKEIGIRKILGASVPGIAALLSVDFLKLVIISNIIAIPIAYYGISKWLENFAYRIDVSFWIFLIAAIAALVTAFVTVSYQAIKAASADPVKSLRYE